MRVLLFNFKMNKSKIELELKNGSDVSIINLVDNLIEYAHTVRASDIHLDPNETGMRVRLRIDGVLDDVFIFPKAIPVVANWTFIP